MHFQHSCSQGARKDDAHALGEDRHEARLSNFEASLGEEDVDVEAADAVADVAAEAAAAVGVENVAGDLAAAAGIENLAGEARHKAGPSMQHRTGTRTNQSSNWISLPQGRLAMRV